MKTDSEAAMSVISGDGGRDGMGETPFGFNKVCCGPCINYMFVARKQHSATLF